VAPEMRSDAELLSTFLDDPPMVSANPASTFVTPLSVKLIAHWTGLSAQTISDYRTGKTNIPVDFWRRILEHWYDPRVVRLLIPDAYLAEIIPLAQTIPDAGSGWFREIMQAERAHYETQIYLADILADGRVDETDAASIQAYDDAFHSHRHREALLHRAILTKFTRSVAAKGARA